MLYEALERWLQEQPYSERGRAALVIHTSCVNYAPYDLERASRLPIPWILPNNVYWELRLLQDSKLFRRKAVFLLVRAQRAAWDLEQLYDSCQSPVKIPELSLGTLIFVFGDLNKQDEFLAHASKIFGSVAMVADGWSCVAGTLRVVPLSGPIRHGVRDSGAFLSSVPAPAISKLSTICVKGNGVSTISGRALIPTGMCGSYARIYKHPLFPNRYVKLYKEIAWTGAQVKKLENLQKIKQQAPSLPLALPEVLLTLPEGSAVGFVMKLCRGRALRDFLSVGWENHDVKAIFQHLFRLLLELHTMHILVNDLSFNNILIDEHDEVSLVDCDSFQVFHYPGGELTEIYRHPEIDSAQCRCTLREPRHEYFALAVLLFQCLFYDDPLRQVQTPEDERTLNWDNAVFPLDVGNGPFPRANREIRTLWRGQEKEVQRAFADEFHFRREVSIGAWIRVLGLLTE